MANTSSQQHSNQRMLVRETSSMLFHTAGGEPILSLAGIWAEAGTNLVCVVATDAGLSNDQVEQMNHEIIGVVAKYLNNSPNLVRLQTQALS